MPNEITPPLIEVKADMKVLLQIEQESGIEGIKNRISLSSYVEEVMPGGYFLIQTPVYRGYNYPLPRDTLIENPCIDTAD